ncbi:hypothetical protein [Burkholderia ubonensis]|uniref:hypothetical protein n=1 Tax=Burkholderia ubonensis TaxID=101571 RepID=UPI0012F9D85D|nr:hypothetical protein [Burkholderia ubonensis]
MKTHTSQANGDRAVMGFAASESGEVAEIGVASGRPTEDVVATVDRDGLDANLVDESVFLEPVIQTENVTHAVHAVASVNGAGFIANANHEARPGTSEIAHGFLSDVEVFNQFCVEFGWCGLRVDSGDNRIPSVAAIEFFHVTFARVLRRDSIEILGYLLKYATTGGFDGVPAPQDWLKKVAKYIAEANAMPQARSA